MICSLPRNWFIGFRHDLIPLFSSPIKDINTIKPLFVSSSTTKDDDSIIMLIITHGTVWSMRWNIASSVYLSPFHGDSIEGPNIVHIIGIYIYLWCYLHNLQNKQLSHQWCSSCVPILSWEYCHFDHCGVLTSMIFFPLIYRSIELN